MSKVFSIVVPIFQNALNIEDTVHQLLALQTELPQYRMELVFVDDGSKDRSFALLEKHAAAHPLVIRVIKLTRNFGQTPAIQAGLRHARGDCVGIISADLQEPHRLFVDMIRAWEAGAQFVIGERESREEGALHKRISSSYWFIVRKFALPDFPRIGYDFCLLDRQVVDDVNHINEKNSSIFVLIYWLGYVPTRIPITRKLRAKGASQWGLWRKVRFTLDTLIAFTSLPARMISVMGFATAALCVIYLVFVTWQWALFREAPPGWMTVVGLLTLFGAMILFAIGIVAEYLMRILDESRKRPPFVVERVIGAGAKERAAEGP